MLQILRVLLPQWIWAGWTILAKDSPGPFAADLWQTHMNWKMTVMVGKGLANLKDRKGPKSIKSALKACHLQKYRASQSLPCGYVVLPAVANSPRQESQQGRCLQEVQGPCLLAKPIGKLHHEGSFIEWRSFFVEKPAINVAISFRSCMSFGHIHAIQTRVGCRKKRHYQLGFALCTSWSIMSTWH